MGRITMGKQDGTDSIIEMQSPITIEDLQATVIEVPVEKIVTVEVIKEIPVIEIIEKPVEIIKEVIIEKPVEIVIEKIIEKPVEVIKEIVVEKEVRVVDIEPLLREKESVRLLKRSNALLRVALVLLLGASLTIIGAMHG